MGRPPNADPETTKARILGAATSLFAARGLAGTSMREIAAHAGISLSLVSHYFGSKEELHREVMRGMLARLVTLRGIFAEDLSGHAADPAAVVARAARLGFRFAREHREAVLLLQRSLFESGALDRELRRRSLVPFVDRSSELLGFLTGRPASALRLPLQSAVFLVVRYAVSSRTDLAAVAGLPAREPEEKVLCAVEEHLVEAISRLLLP